MSESIDQIYKKLSIEKYFYFWFFIIIFCLLFPLWKNKGFFSENFLSSNIITQKSTCNILDFGAKENSQEENTSAIKKAIDACSKGVGGQVVIPEGIWPTGPIKLKDNIELHLKEGAQLVFSSKFDDYLPPVFTRFEGIELYNYSPLIYAKNCKNISITGKGQLNGQGKVWWSWKEKQKKAVERLYELADNEAPVKKRVFGTESDALRPSFVEFVNCKNLSLSNFSISEGPMWTIHLLYSDNIVAKGLTIVTSGPNTDGIVVDSSSNVSIKDINASTGDDAISIKSGLDKEGRKIGRPSKNIFVKNCNISGGNSAISIGSEMSGGVQNVFFLDSQVKNTDLGFRIKSMLGRGGLIDDINVDNITMDQIEYEPIRFDMDYRFSTVRSKSSEPPILRNVSIKNINCLKTYGKAMSILGIPEKQIENIRIKNLKINSERGIYLSYLRNARLENIDITSEKLPLFNLDNNQEISLSNIECRNNFGIFANVSGENSKKINIKNSTCLISNNLHFTQNASENSVLFK